MDTCSASAPAGHQLPRAVAENHGEILPGRLLDRPHDLRAQPRTVGRGAAVLVRPVVVIRGHELRHLMRMRAVDLHAVRANHARRLRTGGIAAHDLPDHLPGHVVRQQQRGIPARLRLRRMNLHDQPAILRMADGRQLAPAVVIARRGERRPGRTRLAVRAAGHDDGRRAAFRARPDIRLELLRHKALGVAVKIAHGRENEAVLQPHSANHGRGHTFHRHVSFWFTVCPVRAGARRVMPCDAAAFR